MKIIQSKILSQFPEIRNGFSTKIGLKRIAPFYFNMSHSVGDEDKNVSENRDRFFSEMGFKTSSVIMQNQTHSDIVRIVGRNSVYKESDAMITCERGIGLAVSSADCGAILVFDNENKVIAGVHSGWRGTKKKILEKTLHTMAREFNSKPENLFSYLAPCISGENYEVGNEVAELFDSKYIYVKENSLYLDIKSANRDMLIDFGISETQIEISEFCSFAEKSLLHSYRRDGSVSGRALALIALKGD